MTPKHLLILLLALFTTAATQSDDELHIPMENDNQFPPEKQPEPELVPEGEGSGANALEDPLEKITDTTESAIPLLEDVKLTSTLANIESETKDQEHSCPTKCVCNIEGDSNNYVVDCTNAGLTELPKPLDSRTTELNLQNNKLTEIPQIISELKNLKILNANNNEIMDIKAGSISELPELISLKLNNNRLIEYPTDLKNSFGLTKLEELDIGGNDMRTSLSSETFINFKALKKLTLPSAAAELAEDLCTTLKESLQTVCTGSCNTKSLDCPDAPHNTDDDLLDFALPGLIAADTEPEEYLDPIISTTSDVKSVVGNQANLETTVSVPNVETNVGTTVSGETTVAPSGRSADGPSFRSAVIQASDDKPVETNSQLAEVSPNIKSTTKSDNEIVEAATTTAKTGGVDKSVIAIVVAGMVLIVAGITIKKNWSSIRKRFSSSPTNERSSTTVNGAAPEEVPLQEKSPV